MTRSAWVAGFWRRVLRLGANQCWPWQGTLCDGYGQLKRSDGQTNIYAHRAAVEIKTGRVVPANRVVMHTCDNPKCVNPSHLRVATQLANVRDMYNKGREVVVSLRGDKHGSSKISEQDVDRMRAMWSNRRFVPTTQETLAAKFGLSQAQVSRILSGKRR